MEWLIAHGLVGRSDLPIPEWLFGWAAAIVLIVSFVALAVLWPEPKLEGERGGWRRLFALPQCARSTSSAARSASSSSA